jgi:hypothetical protein
VFSNISGFVVPMDAQKLKEDMKKHIDILLEGFYEDPDLIRILPDVALQVIWENILFSRSDNNN